MNTNAKGTEHVASHGGKPQNVRSRAKLSEGEWSMLISAIQAMEWARGILGHSATLSPDEITGLTDEDPRVVLARYAAAVVRRQDEESDEDSVVPVVPKFDLEHLQVAHRTCTGRTMLVVRGFGPSVAGGMATGEFQIFQAADAPPLDPMVERDAKLLALIGVEASADAPREVINLVQSGGMGAGEGVFHRGHLVSPRQVAGMILNRAAWLDAGCPKLLGCNSVTHVWNDGTPEGRQVGFCDCPAPK